MEEVDSRGRFPGLSQLARLSPRLGGPRGAKARTDCPALPRCPEESDAGDHLCRRSLLARYDLEFLRPASRRVGGARPTFRAGPLPAGWIPPANRGGDGALPQPAAD